MNEINHKVVLIIACKKFFGLETGELKKVSISLNERPKEVLKSIKIKIYGVI